MEYHTKEEEAHARSNSVAEKEVVRATANFSPSVWGDYFISHTSSASQNDNAWIERKIEELKVEVKSMFGDNDDLTKILSLIHHLQCLGLSYHFEEEISETLRCVHNDNSDTDDLLLVALRFRLLRQQGYNVSSDVFSKFKDEDGKTFKHELSGDAEGILHLYEASWLGTHEDEILDEAQDFARVSMQKLAANEEDEHLTKLIMHALDMPLRRRLMRLEARESISIYEVQGSNTVLLELAKLDFNRVQSLHQAEIKTVSMWWRGLGICSELLSHIRDRAPESYFWSMGIISEPQYSRARILFAKTIILWTVLDDIYDAYGTLDELQLLTNAFDRWDLQDVQHMPEYMRTFLVSFETFIREIEEELMREERIHHMHCIIEMFKSITGAYFEEAKWANEGYTPSLEEYLRNGLSSGVLPMVCFPLCLMGGATEETLEWLLSTPKIVEASTTIGRLLNDISSNKFEQKRLMHVASSLQCYMKDNTGATEHDTTMRLKEMVANALKDINKEWLDPLPSRKHANVLALACAQVMEFLYADDEDSYTNASGKMKEAIVSLLVQPFQD